MVKKLTQEEFIKRCKAAWDETYDLTKIAYKNSNTKVKVVCKVKGHGFWMASPKTFINKPFRGFPKCGRIKADQSRRKVPQNLEKEIKHSYLIKKQSETDIGDKLGLPRHAISGVLNRLGAKRRSHSEAQGGL